MATSQERRPPDIRTIPALIRWHGYAALGCVLYVALLGLVMSIRLHAPDWLGGVSWLSWGRLRYAHTQGLFFGWLGNAFLAFLYFAVPRLAGRPVTGVRLGWALFAVWNGLLVLPGWVLVQSGVSQTLEWAEFPLPVDGAATLGMLMAVAQFVVPLLRARVSDLYVSAWYVLGGLTFTLLAYPVGNVVPEYLPGAQGATFSGLWIHDAVGLFVTPLALAIAYAVIPAVSRRPIYSHFLSMIGFWLLFLLLSFSFFPFSLLSPFFLSFFSSFYPHLLSLSLSPSRASSLRCHGSSLGLAGCLSTRSPRSDAVGELAEHFVGNWEPPPAVLDGWLGLPGRLLRLDRPGGRRSLHLPQRRPIRPQLGTPLSLHAPSNATRNSFARTNSLLRSSTT